MDIMKQKKENAPPNYAKSTKVPIKKFTYSKSEPMIEIVDYL